MLPTARCAGAPVGYRASGGGGGPVFYEQCDLDGDGSLSAPRASLPADLGRVPLPPLLLLPPPIQHVGTLRGSAGLRPLPLGCGGTTECRLEDEAQSLSFSNLITSGFTQRYSSIIRMGTRRKFRKL